MEGLKDTLSKIEKHNTVIIVFANSKYQHVLDNWLEAVNKLRITNYLIIALDRKLLNALKERGVNTLFKPCDPSLQSLWVHRVEVILEMLELGFNLVHSDADAVWLKNPMTKYIYDQPYDMIFSQGTYWPVEVHDDWGFVLCCGFFYIGSNEKTLAFVREWLLDVSKTKDDQVSFNKLLLEKNVKWEMAKKGYRMTYKDKEFICSDEVRQGKINNIRIALLPHSQFQRVKDKTQNVYVKHIISEKNSKNILEVLKENDCYLLNDISKVNQ